MELFAIKNRVIVSPIFEDMKSSGGIALTTEEFQGRGKVLGISPDVSELKIGDVVMFAADAGFKVSVKQEKLVVLTEDDIFCVCEDEDV